MLAVLNAHVPSAQGAEPNMAQPMAHPVPTTTPIDWLVLRFGAACPEVFWYNLQYRCW